MKSASPHWRLLGRATAAALIALLVAPPGAPTRPNIADPDGPSLSVDQADVAIAAGTSTVTAGSEPIGGLPETLAFAEPTAAPTIGLATSATDGAPALDTSENEPNGRQASGIRAELIEAGRSLFSSSIGLRGRVAGPAGPLVGAVVRVGSALATTDEDGLFWFDAVVRTNVTIQLEANGYYPRAIAHQLALAATTELVDIGTVELIERRDGRMTALFAGDVSLGRRYMDPFGTERNDRVPPDHPEALIRPSEAYGDSIELLSGLRSTFAPFDLVSVSLETAVSDRPDTPRTGVGSHVFTLPEAIAALRDTGVDHVALANSRSGDFGNEGILETTAHLDSAGVAHSGAGAGVGDAYLPYGVDVGGVTMGVSSFSATEGQVGEGPLAASYDEAGIADLNNDALVEWSLQAAEVLDLSVAHAHTGYQYTESPDMPGQPISHASDRFSFLADRGVDLVIGHHPNVAQGFGYDGQSLIAHSLGNLVTDHSRIDASIGLALETVWDAGLLATARAVPILLDDYQPTRLTGEPADLTLRRVSSASDPDVVLVPDHDGAIITTRDQAIQSERSVTVAVEPDAFGVAVVDLRSIRHPHESVGQVAALEDSPAPSFRFGRDLMVFGAMEDNDTDPESLDVHHWGLTGNASFACAASPTPRNQATPSSGTRGALALCSLRSATNASASSIVFDTPIVVEGDRLNEPNKDLTFLTRHGGTNRGDLYVDATYRSSVGATEFAKAQILALPAGDHGYTTSWVDLAMPLDDPAIQPSAELPYGTRLRRHNARAVELRIRHLPPASGTGVAFIDDAAVISWAQPDMALTTPNPFDFVRVEGMAPGQMIEITFVRYSLP